MAFSRLFGKNKREVVSPTEHLERDDAETTPPESKPSQDNLPYQMPYQSPYQSPQQPIISRQESQYHPLQGVHFTLSPRLNSDTELQYLKLGLDSVISRLNNINLDTLDYNFALEHSILSSEAETTG
eukprot:GFUD01031010.1.p1 GENE.GFUD01031010.1~~GFUD01031010.1.p1  ORF type:complete len:127 (-),score=42.72 GFUD01031010.1:122-502(-)